MSTSAINPGYTHLQLLNEVAKINPQVAMAHLGQTWKNLVAFELIDAFLESQRARILSGGYCTYTCGGGTAAGLDRAFYYDLASKIIALA